jgi:DNA-binding NtrC family response regulator
MQFSGESHAIWGDARAGEPLKNPFFTTLVADDKVSFRGFLEEFFRSEGHFIIMAETAEQALESTRRFLPDMILLNSRMGDISGLSLIPELLMVNPRAALIMMAFNSSTAEAVEAMRRGAVDYLQRPLNPLLIRRAVAAQKALFNAN